MKVTLKKLPRSQVELTVTVPYELYLKSEKKALEELNKEAKIDGFRSGHIPEDTLRKYVGEKTLQSATLEHLLPQTYMQAVKEHNLQVIAPPKVDIKKSIAKAGDELVYVATVAVMPEVKVGNYKKIKVSREPVIVTPKEVEETIGLLLDRFAEWREVKRKAQKGDRAEVDFEGFDATGKAIPNTKSKNHPMILGQGTMVPGFEDALIGMEVGGTKEFEITFPKTYHVKDLQGKKVKFKAALNRLEEKLTQELTEELIAKMTGEKQSVAEFKKRVEGNLRAEMEYRARQKHDSDVVNEIIKITEMEIPQALTDEELNYMLQSKKEEVKAQGLTWEQYLRYIKKTEADFRKDFEKSAIDRIKARFGVQHIIRDAKIEVTDAEIEAKVQEMIAQYPESEHPKIRKHYAHGSEGYYNLKGSLSADKLIAMLTAK